MARRSSKSTKKREKSRHGGRRQYPYEDWPAFKPVPGTDGRLLELDLDELTPEQRAELDRLDAERERSRERHERFSKKLDYIHKVRDGLLPPPPHLKQATRKPSKPRRGPKFRFDHAAIAKIAKDYVDAYGVPPTKPERAPSTDGLIEAVYKIGNRQGIEMPGETLMKEICGPIAAAWLLKEGR